MRDNYSESEISPITRSEQEARLVDVEDGINRNEAQPRRPKKKLSIEQIAPHEEEEEEEEEKKKKKEKM
jgi:hypothetical protein